MGDEHGQAAVEWVATICAVAVALAVAATLVGPVDGRSVGALLAHRLVCAVGADCAADEGDAALLRAYGDEGAALVRRHMPGLVFEAGERQLPVDWRRCREPACATLDDRPGLDAHVTAAGERATVFTRLLRRGSRTYVEYWTYYPDSNTTFAGSDAIWRRSWLAQLGGALLKGSTAYPGFHEDDWEGIVVRVDRDGQTATRVSSHGHWQWCKHSRCIGRWGPVSGWSRVSRGSHAGHVPVETRIVGMRGAVRSGPGEPRMVDRPLLPGAELNERTATPDAVRVVPLETLDHGRYRRLDPGIAPPWEKDAYHDPESDGS